MNISIIIPCYNEGKTIRKNIDKIKHYLNKNKIKYELIIVDDGSKDNMINILNEIKGITVLRYEENKGKGFAVKKGIEKANNDVILFMDEDLSTDLSAIKLVLENIKNYDIVIGSRRHKNSKLIKKQGFIRKIIGNLCIVFTKAITKINFKDTQCGFKAFKKDVAKEIIKHQEINGWAFDVEYLYIAKQLNYTVKEIPVIWKNDTDSKVKPLRSSISFFNELLKIKKIHKK